jgi:hypothetical protein
VGLDEDISSNPSSLAHKGKSDNKQDNNMASRRSNIRSLIESRDLIAIAKPPLDRHALDHLKRVEFKRGS